MKKIMMLVAVGILSVCGVMAQDVTLDALKKDMAEAGKALSAAGNKYNAYFNKNMSQECKDARKAVADADKAAFEQRVKMLQEDEKYAAVAAKFTAAREGALKSKTKEAKALEAAARKELETAWKDSKKATSAEYKVLAGACAAARKAQAKADSDFRVADEEAAKLWADRTEAAKKANEAKKAYNDAVKAQGNAE